MVSHRRGGRRRRSTPVARGPVPVPVRVRVSVRAAHDAAPPAGHNEALSRRACAWPMTEPSAPPDRDPHGTAPESTAPGIWVDADACPGVVREILFRASERTGVALTLVANQWLRTPSLPQVRAIQVPSGLDVADTEIVRRVRPGDLVVTQDIPLAALVLAKGAAALNPRGELYTRDSIAERLSIRDFMDELRGAGIQTGGPPALHARDRQAFAAQLDRWLARRPR
jgi:uncharacterized protein YaiI (UPF0178 family)